VFPGLSSLTGGGGFTGGAAGPSSSGPADGGMFGPVGGLTSPVVVGGFKSDGSASAGAVLPAWAIPAGIAALVFFGWALLRRR
jgi:hypothetical protein